ncbi:MAG: UxaA family hydrolase, partial [Pseudomonadota bacterium]
MADFIRLSDADNVVTATRPLEAGLQIAGVTTSAIVPRGHKLAIADIPDGAPVIKYANIIGYADGPIAAGAHVHTHNLAFRATEQNYDFATDLRPVSPATGDTFMGYRRASGRVGTRNHIAVITSVNCSATAARMIASAFGPAEMAACPNVDGVTAFVHGTG